MYRGGSKRRSGKGDVSAASTRVARGFHVTSLHSHAMADVEELDVQVRSI